MALVHPSTRHFLEYLPEIGPQPNVLGYISSGPQVSRAFPFFIGAPTGGFASTGHPNFFGTPAPVLPLTLTMTLPTNMLPGDVLFAKVKISIMAGNGAIHDFDPVAGWTEAFFDINAGLALFYHVVVGGELPTVTFSYSAPGDAIGGFGLNCVLSCIRGANNTTPIDNLSFLRHNTTFNSSSAPSVATTVPDCLILIYMEQEAGGGMHVSGVTTPIGTVLELDFQSATAAIEDSCFMWSRDFIGPGTIGPFLSTNWPNRSFQNDLTVAVKPGPPPGSIQGFPAGANGAIAPFPVIVGPATKLVSPRGMFIDSSTALWVADSDSNTTGAVLAFDHPATSGTNTAPDINLTGGTTTIFHPYDVAVDLGANVYVANYQNDDILVFTPGSNGNVAPALTIGGASTTISKPRSVAVASNGDVFVLNDTQNKILVFTAGHVGNVAPDRTITGAATLLNNPLAIRFDSDQHLWVTNAGYLLEFLETDNGNVAPQSQVINADLDAGFDLGIGFDVKNNAYCSVLLGQKVLEFADDSTTGIPQATITGWLSGPWGIAVNIIITPPPNITCIPIEWQTPGRLLDEGRLAVCSRFFIDLNTNGEALSVTILVDDLEFNYPFAVSTTGRETVEIAWQVSGRIYSIRLTGCLTIGQIEFYECWTDIHEGDEQGLTA